METPTEQVTEINVAEVPNEVFRSLGVPDELIDVARRIFNELNLIEERDVREAAHDYKLHHNSTISFKEEPGEEKETGTEKPPFSKRDFEDIQTFKISLHASMMMAISHYGDHDVDDLN